MASSEQPTEEHTGDSSPVSELLNSNKAVVDYVLDKHPTFFKTLSQGHTPKYLMIGCADARIQPNSLLKLNPGELFIHRNIANQVFQGDLNANAVIQYAIEGLDIDDIIIMGHSKCGGIMASMKTIPFEIVDQWLTSIREIYENHKEIFDSLETEDLKATALAKINVRHQCMNVRKSASVKRAIEAGRDIRIHGWFLDVSTGLIEELQFNNDYATTISNIYSDTLQRLSKIDGTYKKNVDLGWDPCCFDEAFDSALDLVMVNECACNKSAEAFVEDHESHESERDRFGSIEVQLPDVNEIEFKPSEKLKTTSFGVNLLKTAKIDDLEDHPNDRVLKREDFSPTRAPLVKDPVTGFYMKE